MIFHDDILCRPKKGWTQWERGAGDAIPTVWREARLLHFPKLNCTAWFDGSELVGLALWGVHGGRWCMKKPPPGWTPRPLAELVAEGKALLNRRRAARGEPPLPSVEG